MESLDENKYQDDYYQLQVELLSFDLSDIPFEAWADINFLCSDKYKIKY